MKNIGFYICLILLPIGQFLRMQIALGGNILLTFGLLFLFLFFLVNLIKLFIQKKASFKPVIIYLIMILMSITLYAKYFYYSFWDYPTLIILPFFVIASLFFIWKKDYKFINLKTRITAGLFFIFSLPILAFEIDKAPPRKYIPDEWNNRYYISGKTNIQMPDKYKLEETKQLGDQALAFKNNGDYDQAISIYTEALKLEPNNSMLYFDLSQCYAYTNKLETAISMLNKAIELDPNFPAFYNNRGLLHYKLNQNKDAKNDFLTTIKFDSTAWVPYANLALVYANMHDINNACKCLNKAELININASESFALKKIKKYCIKHNL